MTPEPATANFRTAGLQPGDSPFATVKAAIEGQLDRVRFVLLDQGEPAEVAVHSARKALKRSRGLLRLIRDSMGRSMYRRINLSLRDAGRVLAPLREASMRLVTFDSSHDLFAGRVDPDVLLETRDCFVAEYEAVFPGGKPADDVLPTVTADIEAAREVLAEWEAGVARRHLGNGAQEFTNLMHGLSRVYLACCTRMKASSISGDFNEFHEWRKQVKYLRYQLEHLRPLAPEAVDEQVAELYKIGECLGEAHDLWVLGNCIEAHPDCCMDREMRELYVGITDDRRRDFDFCALQRGAKMFSEHPADFAARIQGYWKSAPAERRSR